MKQKIIDIRGTKELLLDSLRASSPGRSGGGAGLVYGLGTVLLLDKF